MKKAKTLKLSKVQLVKLNQMLSHDRSQPAGQAREAYLRSLLKLPSTERRT
jgi:hypothetical protein